TADAGYVLAQRLAIYPEYALGADEWVDRTLVKRTLDDIDACGMVRDDDWVPGAAMPPPGQGLANGTMEGTGLALPPPGRGREQTEQASRASITTILERASAGTRLAHDDIVRLFAARGPDVAEICAAADALRASVNGDVVTYVVNRNINYTN